MIKNEKLYRITRHHADQFAEAIRVLEAGQDTDPRIGPIISPRLRRAEIDGMKSVLEGLQAEMKEYEALKAGTVRAFALASLDELPLTLIKARIAAGLTQKELAARMGLKEQQIQRYEANDYASANFERLREIANAIGVRLSALSLEIAAR